MRFDSIYKERFSAVCEHMKRRLETCQFAASQRAGLCELIEIALTLYFDIHINLFLKNALLNLRAN